MFDIAIPPTYGLAAYIHCISWGYWQEEHRNENLLRSLLYWFPRFLFPLILFVSCSTAFQVALSLFSFIGEERSTVLSFDNPQCHRVPHPYLRQRRQISDHTCGSHPCLSLIALRPLKQGAIASFGASTTGHPPRSQAGQPLRIEG